MVGGQAPLGAVVVRAHVIGRQEVALEHFELLAVLETDQPALPR